MKACVVGCLGIAMMLSAPFARADGADDLADVCHAASSYDLAVTPDALVFERATPAPRRVEWRGGALRVDGVRVAIDTESGDRLALFDSELRMLVPRVKAVATRGVDLVLATLREQIDALAPSPSARAQVEQRLGQTAASLRQRIARSTSTRDWQPAALEGEAQAAFDDIAALLAEDTGRRSVEAALNGDMQSALALPAQAGDLAAQLRPKMDRRLRELRPQVAALCPSVRRLAELQQGLRDGRGRALDLLSVDAR